MNQSQRADVIVLGAGHNALVCALLLARSGLDVLVLEAKNQVGGAAKTERPFVKAPELGVSTGAYLLGLMPPELLAKLNLDLPLQRRDPHYFLPTTDRRYLLFGSDERDLKRQFLDFFSEEDWNAHLAMNAEIAKLRDDLAPAWLAPPVSIEETAERYIRPKLRKVFLDLVRGSISDYLDRFPFESDLVKAMYATTDAFSGLDGCFDTPGTGHNFLAHNMCRLPGASGTWMIVEGGMGVITQQLADAFLEEGGRIEMGAKVAAVDIASNAVAGVTLENGERRHAKVVVSGADPFATLRLLGRDHVPAEYTAKIDGMYRPGSTLKVNLAFDHLPTFTCLPNDHGQFGPTIHLLPQGDDPIGAIREAYDLAKRGELAGEPTIEWYFHTPIDPSLKDHRGRHNGALFVQWVPHTLANGKR
jgi:phytoene dehydrogenase-like protein